MTLAPSDEEKEAEESRRKVTEPQHKCRQTFAYKGINIKIRNEEK